MSRVSHPQPLGTVFAVPAVLGVASLAGLVFGLAGDGWWDAAAWVLLGLVPATFLHAWLTRRS